MRKSLVILAFALFVGATTALAATVNVPADQPTIQAGINSASNGDTVLVAPGTYRRVAHSSAYFADEWGSRTHAAKFSQ